MAHKNQYGSKEPVWLKTNSIVQKNQYGSKDPVWVKRNSMGQKNQCMGQKKQCMGQKNQYGSKEPGQEMGWSKELVIGKGQTLKTFLGSKDKKKFIDLRK